MTHAAARAIETERLVLRLFRAQDADALFPIYSDPQTMRYISSGIHTYERVQQYIAMINQEWKQRPWGVWAVVWKENAALIGTAGFVRVGEIGYIIHRAYWGRGIATEALRACLRYGFEVLQLDLIGAGALKANLASLRVIEKAGMHPVSNEFFDSHGGAYYHIERASFQPGDSKFVLHPTDSLSL